MLTQSFALYYPGQSFPTLCLKDLGSVKSKGYTRTPFKSSALEQYGLGLFVNLDWIDPGIFLDLVLVRQPVHLGYNLQVWNKDSGCAFHACPALEGRGSQDLISTSGKFFIGLDGIAAMKGRMQETFTGNGCIGTVREWYLDPNHVIVDGGNGPVAVQSDLCFSAGNHIWFATHARVHFPYEGNAIYGLRDRLLTQFQLPNQAVLTVPDSPFNLNKIWMLAHA